MELQLSLVYATAQFKVMKDGNEPFFLTYFLAFFGDDFLAGPFSFLSFPRTETENDTFTH